MKKIFFLLLAFVFTVNIVTAFECNSLGSAYRRINKYAKHKIIEIKKIKRGLEISLIPFSSTLFMIKTYLFGISFNFSIGRFRD